MRGEHLCAIGIGVVVLAYSIGGLPGLAVIGFGMFCLGLGMELGNPRDWR